MEPMANGYIHTECNCTYVASDLDQRCLKTRNAKDGCMYFPTKYIRPYPQN